MSSGLRHALGLAPELDLQLKAVGLEAFAPVLIALGVESIADLGLVQDSDLENKDGLHVTDLQKQNFREWKTEALDEQRRSKTSNKKERSPRKKASNKLAAIPGTKGPASDVDVHEIFENSVMSKKLYHDLCKKHHPDKGGDAEMFSSITDAYNVNVDPLESYLGALATPPMAEIKERRMNDRMAEIKEKGRLAAFLTPPVAEIREKGILAAMAKSHTPEAISLDSPASMHTEQTLFLPEERGRGACLKTCFGCLFPPAPWVPGWHPRDRLTNREMGIDPRQ